ncbi:MAG: L,D-transpeptidase [Clostridia bacterium]|nr:L,D-transpeptidase [Clostridia bacterium]
MIKKRIALLVLCCIIFSATNIYAKDKNIYKYSIDVNVNQNVVTVYELDQNGEYTIPNRAFVCSVGKDTPLGSFKTSDKYKWRELFGNVYGQYATRITGHILFHSVPYSTMSKNDLEYDEYNKLGTSASMGCIRLCVRDAKWIYDNCPIGTTVNIIDSDSAGPLPKPIAYNIDVNDTEKRGWDPTDPDLSNPYKDSKGTDNNENYAPKPDTVIDFAGMKINGNMFYLGCYNINGCNYFKISDIEKIFELAGISFSYDCDDTNNAGDCIRINTSETPSDSDYKKLYTEGANSINSAAKVVLALYGNQKMLINAYSIGGKNYYSIRDIAGMSQLNVLWDKTSNCIELENDVTT